MKKMLGFIFGAAFTALSGAAFAQGLEIPQVSKNAAPTGNAEANINATNEGDNGGNYQNDIMSDPTLNDRARAEAVMNAGKNKNKASELDGVTGGNTAVITQSGSGNISSVTQSGSNNTAIHTQTGKSNDIRVEQKGKNNRSVEHQNGEHSHKVIIQNGNTTEDTTIEQVAPANNRE